MKKFTLLLLTALSSSTFADYLHIHYQGTITSTTYRTVLPFGFTEENPQGYQIGDTFSDTMVIDIDIANSFEALEIPSPISPMFNSTYYNTPMPTFNNQRIQYQNYMNVVMDDAIEVQNKLANASQSFIVGGFNKEPSVVNQDYVDITNYNNPDAGLTGSDSIAINNRDSISNPYFPFNQGHTMKLMSLNIKSDTIDFISDLSLNQEFSLSGDDLIGTGGYNVTSPWKIDYTKKPHEHGTINFTLDAVVAEVSPYPHEDCSICQ